jgi:hypothetical protein
MFNYVTNRQGYLPYTTDTAKRVFKSYYIIEQNGQPAEMNPSIFPAMLLLLYGPLKMCRHLNLNNLHLLPKTISTR